MVSAHVLRGDLPVYSALSPSFPLIFRGKEHQGPARNAKGREGPPGNTQERQGTRRTTREHQEPPRNAKDRPGQRRELPESRKTSARVGGNCPNQGNGPHASAGIARIKEIVHRRRGELLDSRSFITGNLLDGMSRSVALAPSLLKSCAVCAQFARWHESLCYSCAVFKLEFLAQIWQVPRFEFQSLVVEGAYRADVPEGSPSSRAEFPQVRCTQRLL